MSNVFAGPCGLQDQDPEAMAPTELVNAFDARLSLYGIDGRAKQLLAEIWPVIAPSLEPAIDEILSAIRVLPRIGEIVTQNRTFFRKLETAHFRALLGGALDQNYAASCRETVAQEAALGFDARIRSTAGSYVLKGALAALARKYPFSSAKTADRATIVAKVIAFDVANAMTLHRQAAEQAAAKRRAAIDEAIADFAAAIGAVVEAIKEASGSLSATCATLSDVAEDTRRRMAAASAASAETTQRMAATATATEELSGSVREIGEQATRGLGMAQSAVADAERTQDVIRSRS